VAMADEAVAHLATDSSEIRVPIAIAV